MVDILLRDGTSLKNFLSSLVFPLQSLTTEMNTFEAEAKKRAKLNGQKMILEAGLNNIFGITVAPFIKIENESNDADGTAFFNNAELSPVYFSNSAENDPVYFLNSAEVSSTTYDFKVLIPIGIYTTELERRVKSETNIFKVAGTRFIIETY